MNGMTETIHAEGCARLAPPSAVHVATTEGPSEAWPRPDPFMVFAVAGLVILAIWVVLASTSMLGIRLPPGPMFVVLIGVFALVGLYSIIRAVRRRRSRAQAERRESDPTSRLRVIGVPAEVEPLTRDLANVTFEPVVMRSVYATSQPSKKKDGTVRTRRRRGRTYLRTCAGPMVSRVTLGICMGLGAALAVAAHFVLFDRRFTFNYFEVMAGMGLGVCAAAFVRPVYLRLAPGVLDVFHYGPLGSGTPRVDRYDLRTARVAVHLDHGYVRVEDANDASRPVLFVRLNRLMGAGTPRARHFLQAAYTTHPTPPLPMDALDG
jgi:hypothetical protein